MFVLVKQVENAKDERSSLTGCINVSNNQGWKHVVDEKMRTRQGRTRWKTKKSEGAGQKATEEVATTELKSTSDSRNMCAPVNRRRSNTRETPPPLVSAGRRPRARRL